MFAFRYSNYSAVVLRGISRVERASGAATGSLTHHHPFILRAFSSESTQDFQTGTVLFYLRNKAYGFITPDNDPSKQVWVHRTSFDSPHPDDAFPTRPYLLKGESVKFRIEPRGSSDQADKAVDLRFANGRQVPLYRKNYHASVVRGEMQRLGEMTFEILKQDLPAEQQLELMKKAAQHAEEQIALAEEKQSKYGPELE